jgi:tetratricopeptide (TPR) repeat protein
MERSLYSLDGAGALESDDRSTAAVEARPEPTGRRSLGGTNSRYRLPCVGRQAELSDLFAALKAAERGEGSAWAIVGPAGIGKSRLLREVETVARRRGFRARLGYTLKNASIPLFPFRQIFPESFAGDAGSNRGAPGERPGPTESVDSSILEMMRGLRDASDDSAQLLIVDDFEAADTESRRALQLLARALPTSRAVLLVAVRDEPQEGESTLAQFERETSALQRSGALRVHYLPPLSQNQGAELITAYLRGASGRGVRPTLVGELVAQSGGNPFFILETVDAWVRDPTNRSPRAAEGLDASTPTPDDDSWAVAGVSRSIRDLIQERVRSLDPEDRLLLALAARIGVEFDVEPLAAALGRPAPRIAARLRRLARATWPVHLAGGPANRFAFDHGLLRECLGDPASYPLDADLLDRLAEWWHDHRPDDRTTEARLWAAVRRTPELTRAIRATIDSALEAHAWREIPRQLRWLVAHLPAEEQTPEFFGPIVREILERVRTALETEGLTDLLGSLHRFPLSSELAVEVELRRIEAIALHDPRGASLLLDSLEERAAPLLRPGVLEGRWRIQYLRGLTASAVEMPQLSARTVRAALSETRRRPGAEFETMRLYAALGNALANGGRLTEARGTLREARRFGRAHGLAAAPITVTLGDLDANLLIMEGRTARAYRRCTELLERYHALGFPDREAMILMKLSGISLSCRNLRRTREHLGQAQEIMGRLGIPGSTWAVDMLVGWLEIFDRNWDAARRALTTAAAPSGRIQWSATTTYARIGLALVRAETGDPAGAMEDLRVIYRKARIPTASCASEYYRVVARIHELQGRPTQCRLALEKALRISQRIPSPMDEVCVLAELAEWTRRHGSVSEYAARQRAFRRFCARHQLSPHREWKGVGVPPSDRPRPAPRGPRPEPGKLLPPANRPFREVLLEYLSRAPSLRTEVRRATPTFTPTQADIARDLGVPRDRFARALQRLLERGQIERTRVRIVGRARSEYGYRVAGPARA